MGFGTLFIGYFLLLNITYYTFTDVIAASVMLLGLYKLGTVSKYFRAPAAFAALFAVFGFAELAVGVLDMLFIKLLSNQLLVSALAISRSLILAALTLLMLKALYGIAHELDVEKVPLRCRTMMVWTTLLYGAQILFETPFISAIIPTKASAILYLAIIIGMIVVVISNLTIIYSCYMQICMPDELNGKKEKPSRFEFVNEYRRRKAEREAENEAEMRRRQEEKLRRKKKK